MLMDFCCCDSEDNFYVCGSHWPGWTPWRETSAPSSKRRFNLEMFYKVLLLSLDIPLSTFPVRGLLFGSLLVWKTGHGRPKSIAGTLANLLKAKSNNGPSESLRKLVG